MYHLKSMKHAHSVSMIFILMAVCCLPQGMGWIICPYQGTVSLQSCGACSLAPAANEIDEQTGCCNVSAATAETAATTDILTTSCCQRLSEMKGYIAQQTEPCRIQAPTAAAIFPLFHVEDQPDFQAIAEACRSVLTRHLPARHLFQDNCALLI